MIFVLGGLLFFFGRKHECAVPVLALFAYFALYFAIYLLNQIYPRSFFLSLVISLGFLEGPILLSAVLHLTTGKKDLLPPRHFIPAVVAAGFFFLSPFSLVDPLYIAAAGSRSAYAVMCAVFLWGVYKESAAQNWYRWVSLFVYYILLVATVKITTAILAVLDASWTTPVWIVFVKTAGAAFIIVCLLWWALMKPEIYGNMVEKSDPASDFDRSTYNQMIHLFETEEMFTDMDINLKMVAERIAVTERELSAAVNRVTQRGFRAVLRSYRVKKACELLLENSSNKRTILEISLEAGFASKSVFHTAFREDTGFTPSAYVKNQIDATRKAS